jgi:hypothetical protein
MRTHIVFGATTRGTLMQAFKINQITERIVAIEDDLMLGPLGNIFLNSVQSFRLKWWEQILNEEDRTGYIPYLRDSFKNFNGWANTHTDKDSLFFWVGDSSTEQIGFMCLLAICQIQFLCRLLLEDNGILRICKNRQVETVPVEYFDQEIIDRAKRISQEKFHLKAMVFSML